MLFTTCLKSRGSSWISNEALQDSCGIGSRFQPSLVPVSKVWGGLKEGEFRFFIWVAEGLKMLQLYSLIIRQMLKKWQRLLCSMVLQDYTEFSGCSWPALSCRFSLYLKQPHLWSIWLIAAHS